MRQFINLAILTYLALALMFGSALADTDSKTKETVSFYVEIQELSVNYAQFFAVAMPDELIEFDVQVPPNSERQFKFESMGAQDTLQGPTNLSWQAPKEPGVYHVNITSQDTQEVMSIHVFVLRPLDEAENGVLNGYRIGAYPDKALRNNPKYLPPAGLIEYTPAMSELAISPNFKLKQFLCKQKTNSEVKYLLVRPALVLKLERLLAEVRSQDIAADTLFVMSGYRTPYYNQSIGNVQFSRHVFGDAADVYVDYQPKNGWMDDINKDGKINRKDAALLYDMADELDKVFTAIGLSGGVGEYQANSVRGPFVHVDARGHKARWGR